MGLEIKRYFTREGIHPFSEINWIKRDSIIRDSKGNEVFRQDQVEAPDFWSETAINIIASKYFFGKQGSSERETSVKQVISRIVDKIREWGIRDNYFDEQNGKIFGEELSYILVNQLAAYNSPVWFNLNVYQNPQLAACYILSVEDNMESILDWYKQAGLIFKHGSGMGVNISTLRSSKEFLSSGGRPSGPVSFARGSDSIGGIIKSGGAVRRSASMIELDIWHPNIMDFIECKIESRKQEDALEAAGIKKEIGDDSLGIPHTNSNHAIRLSDTFMEAVKNKEKWNTRTVKENKICEELEAVEVLDKIAEAISFVGDPGVQFSDTMNEWNTTAEDGSINGTNPCNEFAYLDDSACNLASIRLTGCLTNDAGLFLWGKFGHIIDILIISQDILVDNGSYPSKKIEENSKRYRPLGLGFTDLGSLFMRMGLSYDSDSARNFVSGIASFMTARAYLQSIKVADVKGESDACFKNQRHLKKVIEKHRDFTRNLPTSEIGLEALSLWDKICSFDYISVRNMQVTLVAPAGTISFLMDCNTTGIEPELALVKYKNMVGGGFIRIVNGAVKSVLVKLGYNANSIKEILKRLEETGNIEDLLKPEHLSIFDCAFKIESSDRFLSPRAHVDMMSAVQPFISGAISKTVSLPCEIESHEIVDLIIYAYERGIKGVTFYRDGCRVNQPLITKKEEIKEKKEEFCPIRKKLPVNCNSKRHKFRVGETEGYLHTGMYEDGTLGEVFVTISKEGSTIAGLMDTIATLTSISLQYGVPLQSLISKFSHVRFEPSGFTDDPKIRVAKSLVDYIFRFLGENYSSNCNPSEVIVKVSPVEAVNETPIMSGKICPTCGSLMIRTGSCYTCDCGFNTGCG